jgi:hypothetical protein
MSSVRGGGATHAPNQCGTNDTPEITSAPARPYASNAASNRRGRENRSGCVKCRRQHPVAFSWASRRELLHQGGPRNDRLAASPGQGPADRERPGRRASTRPRPPGLDSAKGGKR